MKALVHLCAVQTGVITGWIFKVFRSPGRGFASRLATSIAGLSAGRTFMKGQPEHIRFWAKVSICDTGCWIWNGGKTKDGYGVFWAQTQKLARAHVWSFTKHVSEIKKGMELDHLCPVTHRENLARGTNFISKLINNHAV